MVKPFAESSDDTVERICDMRDGFKLQLHWSKVDGDIHVAVIPDTHRATFDSVEFCNSGTQSPRTYRALIELFKAMQEDAKDRKQC